MVPHVIPSGLPLALLVARNRGGEFVWGVRPVLRQGLVIALVLVGGELVFRLCCFGGREGGGYGGDGACLESGEE